MKIQGVRLQGTKLIPSGAAAVESDTYFNLVSLLLPGNGTNGAQNNTFLDSSTNNFTVTRNGNTTQGTFSPFSQTGWSNYFDGSGDSITAPDNVALEFGSGDFTIEAFVYLNAYSASYSGNFASLVVARDASSARSYIFSIIGTASSYTGLGFIIFDAAGNANLNFIANSSVALNTWYHVAVSRSGTTFRLFLNGQLIGTTTSAVPVLDTATPTRIGAGAYSGFEYYLTGYISNVRIVKGTAVYTAAFTPPSAPLTAITNTSLLTCQSNRFVDNSANAFAITVAGNTSVQAFSPFDPTTAYSAGTVGGSGYFDGSGDYLTVPDNAALDLGTSDFCIEGWAYLNSTTEETIVAKWGALAGTSSYLVYVSAGTLTLLTTTNGFNIDVNLAGAAVSTESWFHFAVVRSGSSYAIFQNGSRTATTTNSNTIYDSATVVSVGRYTGGGLGEMSGYISGLRIVKGSSVYNPSVSTLTVPTTPPTAIANTSLLLNFTNAGITDAAAKNVLETFGGAAISTAQSKFGGSSMAFDGSGDYLQLPASQNFVFGAGDFTIEFWVRFNANNARQIIAYYGNNAGSNVPWLIELNASFKLRFLTQTSGGQIYVDSSATPSTNTWYHVAAVRNGTSAYLFVDGVSQGTITPGTNALVTEGNPVLVGMFWGGLYSLNGYIDDLRITKGYARYTANFTAPTQAFPTQ